MTKKKKSVLYALNEFEIPIKPNGRSKRRIAWNLENKLPKLGSLNPRTDAWQNGEGNSKVFEISKRDAE